MKWSWLAVRCGVLLVVLMASQVLPAAADESIVSHADLSVQVSGPWQSATSPADQTGSPYLFRSVGGNGATVFWPFPSGLKTGQYQVFTRWTSASDRTTTATYWVASDEGRTPVARNQQVDGGTWQPLGTFSFKPGDNQGVTLTDSQTGAVVADAIRWVGPQTSETRAEARPWTVTIQPTDLRAGPDAATDRLASVPQFSYLQILDYVNDWAYVYNPRARGTAYVPTTVLGESDPPPAWVTTPPPAPIQSVERTGRTVGRAPLAYYPVDDKFAYTTTLGHNVAIMVHDRVQAADGSTWYRVDNGYLSAASVRLPRPPTRTFSSRWLDADLQEPAMLTAYEGDTMIMNALAIKGTVANQTPTGTFFIGRRVQDETMDSGTIGIDPHGPGGYHLEHVLNTQYFTNDGASIHYNYWSSNFGYSGSHGCLGLDLQVSQFMWTWATIGTPIVIHS